MPGYRVEWLPSAARAFRKLATETQRRVAPHVNELAENPRPAGAKKIGRGGSLYRIRVGDYRVVYDVNDREQVVTVATVGHRREVYRRRP